ncbi:hypothetical protein J2Y45_004024 [Dyadobacter sp. BE34]|uniref:Macroglobulin domain-containing protein n=1 Tax=Dyadobacter fermentans TaxID=94254 RepID=A0ABU1R096_9BACT|nr:MULTISPECIES: hypothetical protein [Dyadobacter]MDR6806832.1 hypothetical protein [Dyadobacter fermentans]MDR7044574.1 hypothetical protein [Dyadobacter sp. BE242]MDR7198884.1 hypothetical protein [Dyadobacter sp. BE34]MDR7216846.1 hypothetical protein [Dyadobacter sp. BE31]MDR7263628.1 hypothetical protein [Dyadobacter sp. BE32]
MQKLLFILFGCLGFCAAKGQAPSPDQIVQDINKTASTRPKTLVYLQTSKGVFQRGEDIWFKAYIMDAQSLVPIALDTTLFIQLRSADSSRIVSEEKILIDNGFASGQLSTRNTIPGVEYLLAAFTPHSILKDTSEFKAFRRLKIADNAPATPRVAASDSIFIDFFPEGGNLVGGVANLVAWKAWKPGGRPVQINAVLLENGQPIMNVSSNRLGTGKFQFVPQQSAKYTVRSAQSRAEYKLPDALPAGIVLHLAGQSKAQFSFLLTKTSDSPLGQIFVAAQARGIVCALFQGKMTGDSLRFNLPAAKLPHGIAQVTVYDEKLRPLAERLIFAHAGQNLVVRATLSQAAFRPRERVKVHVKVTDAEGMPVVAHLGASVYDSFYQSPADRLSIVSYTHLHSQIRGPIADPDYYFNPNNADREQALDLLLLTQGWRPYVWAENGTIVPGQVVLSNRMAGHLSGHRDFPPMLLAFAPDGSGIQNPIPIRPDGSFALSIDNMLLGRMYLKSLGDQQQIAKAKIWLDDPFAKIRDLLAAKRVVEPFFTPFPPETAYRSALSRSIVLDEFVVTGKGKTYTDQYIQGLDSLARFSWNTDFVGACNWLNCLSCGSGKKPVEGVSYSKFRDGRPSQHGPFKSEDVVKEPYKYPVYTEEELLAKFNLTRATGYQVKKQFYQPDYQNAPLDAVDDQRNTLLWNPAVVTDEKGEATLEFYCSDITGTFIGNIEGLDGTGKLAAATFGFTVQDDGKEK